MALLRKYSDYIILLLVILVLILLLIIYTDMHVAKISLDMRETLLHIAKISTKK